MPHIKLAWWHVEQVDVCRCVSVVSIRLSTRLRSTSRQYTVKATTIKYLVWLNKDFFFDIDRGGFFLFYWGLNFPDGRKKLSKERLCFLDFRRYQSPKINSNLKRINLNLNGTRSNLIPSQTGLK